MSQPTFKSAGELAGKADAYFKFIEGEFITENDSDGSKNQTLKKTCIREPEPPTLSGLAYFLGFASRQDLFDYEQKGKYAGIIKRARLKIEAAYEKKLSQQSSTGAIFALKSMGWNEKPEDITENKYDKLTVQIIETGPQPAGNEKEVIL